MISVSEVVSLAESQAHFKALKPWWDVLMDYLVVIMVMVSFFSATLLIITDKVVCMPVSTKSAPTGLEAAQSVRSLSNTGHSGYLTNLDYQQYLYVSAVCYQNVVPWQSKYFPYLALVTTLSLLFSSHFWFKYPKTSSKIDHFLSILAKCFESPWTTRALEETTDQQPHLVRQKSSCSRSVPYTPRTPLLRKSPFSLIQTPVPSIMDKKEEEQAKALFEKIRHFRSYIEDSDIVYRVYTGQTVIKMLKVVVVLGYTFSLIGTFSFQHICKPAIQPLMGYTIFNCTHNLAFILEKLLLTYILLVSLYTCLLAYALFWLCSHSLKVYSFEKKQGGAELGDIPDVKKDFAFLLHMIDHYDSLYSKRFSVFLSAVSEGRLREMELNSEWTMEKLGEFVTKDTRGRRELQLSMLPAIPKAVYNLTEVEVLKLELIASARISGAVSRLSALTELHLIHCSTKMDTDAYCFLQNKLKVLHIRFTDLEEIPPWIYNLKSLQELHLSGNLNSSNNKSIRLNSLRGLTHLRALSLNSNVQHLPSAILDVAGQLSKLSIQNGGTTLDGQTQLKRMKQLLEVELQDCQISKIPGVLSSLLSLQCIDLSSNLLNVVNEIGTFQRLRGLTILRLNHNAIGCLPPSIQHLHNLEELSISHNRLETIPTSLFSLVRLRNVDISHNNIKVIPLEVGQLSRLEWFAVTGNQISSLPHELCRCTRLRSLKAGFNNLSSLPTVFNKLTLLSTLELAGNHLISLPVEIASCSLLLKGGLNVEEHVLKASPLEIKRKFLCKV
ncbi:hypothetical protein XENTR_v10009870 [Xenopus tropicalis]|uniref:Volume-regulated anion channel subunit LRRC8D n=1 Tax=Xenopus tropicalis TaxID=8364 RepID=A0A6I8QRX6_XENTR|nr:volume-regulated anion channel subunit LRRC8D [Xenopus tropicalis]KAE8619592.1 hypothetical protein XENTR_v10009870 [Xenopus tropicalis]|eukprot:XP_002935462.1 PREDICTED: volume-regulated anion channel subunit LRRC8D-like [Xenopus tropicalis]